MLKEYLVKKALDASFIVAKEAVRGILREKKVRLTTTRDEIQASLEMHIQSINNWSEEVSFNDLRKAKLTTEVFIPLDLFVYPRRIRIHAHESIQSIPLAKLFAEDPRHFILLGQPGAGKTTSMKYLCQLLLHDEQFHPERFSFPILVRCRELSKEIDQSDATFLFDYIFRTLGLRLRLPTSLKGNDRYIRAERNALRQKVVINFLESLRVLLIVDGFDEIAKYAYREKCLSDITKLANQLNKSTLVLTSRTGDFDYNVPNAGQYEICPLNESQITSFANAWLEDPKRAKDFLGKVKKTPFADAAIRPLTLAHLCAIYDRIEDIPEKPKTIYKKIVGLLLEEWDQQRSIKRKSKYAHFEPDRKYDFLCHLAYALTVILRTTVFSSEDLLRVYHEIRDEFGLEEREARRVIAEIETHNGLFLQSGYEQYEFAHKSLQEFLAAEFLVKLPSIPQWNRLSRLPNEAAIAVAVSSSPGTYFAELVFRRLNKQLLTDDFLRAFLTRLLIEKPDLRSEASVQLALLSLLSQYLDMNFVKGGQPWSFQADALLNGWESFIKKYHSKSLIRVLQCYESERIYDTKQTDLIHRLTLDRKSVANDLQRLMSVFPKTLLLRTSLIHHKSKRT